MKIDFVIVNWRSWQFVRLCVASILAYADRIGSIVIVDNTPTNPPIAGVRIYPNPHEHPYHDNGLTYGVQQGDGDIVCLLDPDTVFLGEWVSGVVSLLQDNVFVSGRWEPAYHIARPHFLVIRRQDLERAGSTFSMPNTGKHITEYCQRKRLPFCILPNTYNNPELSKDMAYPDVHGEEVFLGDHPIFKHQGRGGLKGDRSKWLGVFAKKFGVAL